MSAADTGLWGDGSKTSPGEETLNSRPMDRTGEALKYSLSLPGASPVRASLALLCCYLPGTNLSCWGNGQGPRPNMSHQKHAVGTMHLAEALTGSSPSHPACRQVVLRQQLLLG